MDEKISEATFVLLHNSSRYGSNVCPDFRVNCELHSLYIASENTIADYRFIYVVMISLAIFLLVSSLLLHVSASIYTRLVILMRENRNFTPSEEAIAECP